MNEAKRKLALGIRITLILILFLTLFIYRLVYFEMTEKRDAIREENKALQVRLEELEKKVADKETYEKRIENAEAELRQILGKYSVGNTPEKSILFVREMEDEIEVKIPNISFSAPTKIASADVSGMGMEQAWGTIDILSEQLSMSYSCTYEQWKDLLSWIANYPERRTIRSINASYNSENGTLSGTLVLEMYAVNGGEKEYVAPKTDDITLGMDSIFPE